MWFESWESILNILVTGAVCFVGLIILLRVAGKRTLTKMNAFDFVMTITIGSTLASAITSDDTTVADGMAALFILVMMQYIIAWLEVRSEKFQKLIKSSPTILFYDGNFKKDKMHSERITEVEILAAIRNRGYSDPSQIHMIILETDGRLSVIAHQNSTDDLGAMRTVESFNPE